MTSSDQAYISIQLELNKDHAQNLSLLIDEKSILPRLSGYFEVLYDDKKPSNDLTKLMLYFPPDEPLASSHLHIVLNAIGCEDYSVHEEMINRIDYLEAYKKHYTSFSISKNIRIVPSWEKEEQTDYSSINLFLDPGLAFGTGKHPTTQLCLEFLDTNRPTNKSIIDAGCGSGILSIGALLLGANKVLGFDVDAHAIHASRQNLALNQENISGELSLLECGFDKAPLKTHNADLLIGNLTASILLQNKSYIKEGLYPEILLSGVLSEQKEKVLVAYLEDWDLLFEAEREGWVLLHFTRK